MYFYDMASRMINFARGLVEAVANLPDEQQRMIDKYGTGGQLVVSNFPGEHYLKFWIMNDGTLIPVKSAHDSTARTGGSSHWGLLVSGAARGHIDRGAAFMAFAFNNNLTDEQIESLKRLFVKYRIKEVMYDKYEGGGYNGPMKSANHLEHYLKYGPVEEKKVEEDGSPAAESPGMTTEDDISYIPAHLGASSRKRRKKIRNRTVKEAVDEDLRELQSELKKELIGMFNDPEFLDLSNAVNAWQSAFGRGKYRTNDVAVSHENKRSDIQRLHDKILKEYGDDKGYLEMVIASIQDRRPLNQFEVFNDHENLFGTRVENTVDGIKLVFEATVDYIYDHTQSIYVDDRETLDEIEDEFGEVKRSRSLLYPNGGKFRKGFFGSLFNLIKDMTENQDEEQIDTRSQRP